MGTLRAAGAKSPRCPRARCTILVQRWVILGEQTRVISRECRRDRLVPLFLATLAVRQQRRTITFSSALEMLDTFGMQQGGSQYRRLIGAFQRIFGATIFFGSDMQLEKAAVVHHARFNFMSEARIWYSRDPGQQNLPGDCQNMIVLSEEFYREIQSHPIPADLEAAKALSSSPAVLDLYMWLSYRCFAARGEERVPLFGDFGLVNQLEECHLCPSSEVPRAIGTVVGPRAHDVAGMPGVHQSGRSSDHRQARVCHSACGEQPCLCLRSTTGCLCGKRPWPK